MTDYRDTFTSEIYVNQSQAADAVEKYTKKLADLQKKLSEIDKSEEGWEKKEKNLQRQIKSTEGTLKGIQTGVENYQKAMDSLDGRSLANLIKLKKQLNSEIRKLVPGTQEFINRTKDLKKVEERINSLTKATQSMSSKMTSWFSKYWTMFDTFSRTITGVSMKFRQAAEDAAKLDDTYSDVMKTTGLMHDEVQALDGELMKLDTRTSREQLLLLARDAGKLGIQGSENILGFVRAADQIQVALGEDLGEGAIRNLGKIADVFGYTKQMGIEGSLLSIGSAINAVGQASTANEAYLVDFTQRLAGVGAQTGISAANIIGFASGLDQSAMKVEMAATAFQTFLTKLYEDPAKFAEYANMQVKEFSDLLKNDANTAVVTILKNLKDQDGFSALVPIFKNMGVDGARATSVLAAMASNLGAITDAQALANVEFEKANSLSQEFTTKNNNMQASLDKAKKEFKNASIALGQSLNPIMLKSTKGITYLIKALANYGKEIKAAVISIAALTAVIKLNSIAHTVYNAVVKAGAALKASWIVVTKAASYAINIFRGRTVAATKAYIAMKTAMSTSVFGILAAAVTAVTVAIVRYTKKANEASEATKKMSEIDERINSEYAESASKVQVLTNIVHNNNLAIDQRRAALKKLQEIVPAYHADLTKEGQLINDNTEAITVYLKNLEKVTRAKILEDEYTQATAAVLNAEQTKQNAEDRKTQALIDANGDTAEMTYYIMQSTAGAFSVSNITPYGQAVKDEIAATEELTKAQEIQAKILQRIERENGDAFAKRKGELTAEEMEIRSLNQEYEELFRDIRDESRDNPEQSLERIEDLKREQMQKIAEIRKKYKEAEVDDDNAGGNGNGDEDYQKKNFDARIKVIQQQLKTEERELKLSLLRKQIDENEYEVAIRDAKVQYFKDKIDAARQYRQSETEIMNEFYDWQIQEIEKSNKQQQDMLDALAQAELARKKKKEDEETKIIEDQGKRTQHEQEILEKDLARVKERIGKDTWKEELDFELWKLNELHDQGILSERDYQEAKLKVKLEYAKKAANQVNQVSEMASNFVTQLKEMETAQLESEYQAQLTAAGDNAEQREAIEAEYEQKKLDLQKKYADTEMVINIAKAIAAGALAAVEAFAAAGNPILGAVFAAIVAATTALEVATIVKQRNAIKNMSPGGGGSSSANSTGQRKVAGYASGGFTEDHATLTTVGERGTEWVAPHWMVRDNPVTFSNLERYRKTGSHGRSGSVARGFADGGFTESVSGKAAGGMFSTADLEAAVETAIARSMANGAIRAYLVRNDLTELDAQTDRLKKQTSR